MMTDMEKQEIEKRNNLRSIRLTQITIDFINQMKDVKDINEHPEKYTADEMFAVLERGMQLNTDILNEIYLCNLDASREAAI